MIPPRMINMSLTIPTLQRKRVNWRLQTRQFDSLPFNLDMENIKENQIGQSCSPVNSATENPNSNETQDGGNKSGVGNSGQAITTSCRSKSSIQVKSGIFISLDCKLTHFVEENWCCKLAGTKIKSGGRGAATLSCVQWKWKVVVIYRVAPIRYLWASRLLWLATYPVEIKPEVQQNRKWEEANRKKKPNNKRADANFNRPRLRYIRYALYFFSLNTRHMIWFMKKTSFLAPPSTALPSVGYSHALIINETN